MKKIFILFIFLLALQVKAETNISGSTANISEDQIWNLAGSPYIISGFSDVRIANGVTLTIEPGVQIRARDGKKFDIYGTVNVLGEEGNKVTITSGADDGSDSPPVNLSSRWAGFLFNPGSSGNINYLDAKYSGFTHFNPGGPAVFNQGGEVDIHHSKFSKNFQAIYHKSGTTTIDGSNIDDNNIGIIAEDGHFSIFNSIIANSVNTPVSVYSGVETFIAHDNRIVNSGEAAFLDIGANWDIKNNIFENNYFDHWAISGDVGVGRNVTLGPIDGRPIILYGITVGAGGTLNIEPGTILKVYGGGYLSARGGKIFINGTSQYPVLMTHILDDSVGGKFGNAELPIYFPWMRTHSGIIAEEGGEISVSNMWIKRAGAAWSITPLELSYTAIANNNGVITGEKIKIFDTTHDSAIYHYAGTTTLNNVVVDGVFNNAIKYKEGNLSVKHSNLGPTYANYSLLNLNNLGTPDVRENWWGTPEGPYHDNENPLGTAPRISGHALFKPFLTELPGDNVPEPTVPDPVIIVPGIMGSAYKNGELVIDPILHTYDDLIATLDENGYTPGVDLFTFPFEWRDSNVFTANLLDDKIDQVKSICGCDKVDIIAHSMGGLVARSYIQSGDYDGDVDQVIFLGTPHKGAPTSYLQWEAGKFSPDFDGNVTQPFFQAEAIRNGYSTIFSYIHNRPILSIQELLPIFDYIKDNNTNVVRKYPNNYPRNLFLENLNNNLSNLLLSGVRITNFVGDSGKNKTINIIRVIPTDHQVFWEHGEPEGFGALIGDSGLENGVGDDTVTLYGATLHSSVPDEIITSSHRRIPTISENRVFKILTDTDASTTIDSGFNLSPKVLLLQLLSPIDVVITAPDGKKIGKNFSNGAEYDEIPLAFYSGFETNNEYITILNPLDGEYKIEVQGTGSGGRYGILTSYISDTFATTTQTIGITEPNQITNFNINLDNNHPEDTISTKLVALDILIKDINGAYNLGWIKDKKIRDDFIKRVEKMQKKDKKIDKDLAKLLLKDLKAYKKDKITLEGYNIIKEDIEWLINN